MKTKQYLIYCSNCGKPGHIYKKCNDAIISIGIISYKNVENDIKFLLVRRKYTLGYIEFIRGRYSLKCDDTIKILFEQMTNEEIDKIKKKDFNLLWFEIWKDDNLLKKYKNEYEISKTKFLTLLNAKIFNLDFFIEKYKPLWKTAEWGFPKGRRNFKETNMQTAIREFYEETGYKTNDYILQKNAKNIYELFHGTNGILYKHIYFLAEMITNNEPKLNISPEIGDIGWFSYDETMKLIRPYQVSKRKIITKIYNYLLLQKGN